MKSHRRTTAIATVALALTLSLAPLGSAAPRFIDFGDRFDVSFNIDRLLNKAVKLTQKVFRASSQNDQPSPPKP